MTKLILYSFSLLLMISCNDKMETGSQLQQRISTESQTVKQLIANNNKQIEKWYKTKQPDSLIAYMADNVIQFPPNSSPLKGKNSIKEYWQQMFHYGDIDFSLQTQQVRANGPLAIEQGKYIFRFTPTATESPIPSIVDSGNYLVHWEKINNDWKIVWDAPVSMIPLH